MFLQYFTSCFKQFKCTKLKWPIVKIVVPVKVFKMSKKLYNPSHICVLTRFELLHECRTLNWLLIASITGNFLKWNQAWWWRAGWVYLVLLQTDGPAPHIVRILRSLRSQRTCDQNQVRSQSGGSRSPVLPELSDQTETSSYWWIWCSCSCVLSRDWPWNPAPLQ